MSFCSGKRKKRMKEIMKVLQRLLREWQCGERERQKKSECEVEKSIENESEINGRAVLSSFSSHCAWYANE